MGGDLHHLELRDQNRHEGGVVLYVKNSIPMIERIDIESNCEVIQVVLSRGNAKVATGNLLPST